MTNANTIQAYHVIAIERDVLDCIDTYYEQQKITHRVNRRETFTNVMNENTIRVLFNDENNDELQLLIRFTVSNYNVIIENYDCDNNAIQF